MPTNTEAQQLKGCECPARKLPMDIIRYMQERADALAALCGDKPFYELPSIERYYRNAGASTAIYNLANEIGSEFVNRLDSAPCPCEELRADEPSAEAWKERRERDPRSVGSLAWLLANRTALQAERDSLRAQVEEHQRWLQADSQHAENQRLQAELAASRERERLLREALTNLCEFLGAAIAMGTVETPKAFRAELARSACALATPEGTK